MLDFADCGEVGCGLRPPQTSLHSPCNLSFLTGLHAPSSYGRTITHSRSGLSLHLMCHTRYGTCCGICHRPYRAYLAKGEIPSGHPSDGKALYLTVSRGLRPPPNSFTLFNPPKELRRFIVPRGQALTHSAHAARSMSCRIITPSHQSKSRSGF